jgi:hypothetical protein
MGRVIIPFFKVLSHCDLFPYESLQYYALETEIVNKIGNVGFICNAVKDFY